MALTDYSFEFDGRSCAGVLADGSGGKPAPGVLVAHEGGGFGAHVKERAEMLARLGYVAYAFDMFGGENMPLEEARAALVALRGDPDRLRAMMKAALAALASAPKVDASRLGAIGFCFGGQASLELARAGADLKAVVGFHSALKTLKPHPDQKIAAKILVCLGAADPIISAEDCTVFANEMTAAGADWQIHLYGGVGHSFTNRAIDAWNFEGFRYDETADRRSWAAMTSHFRETFGV